MKNINVAEYLKCLCHLKHSGGHFVKSVLMRLLCWQYWTQFEAIQNLHIREEIGRISLSESCFVERFVCEFIKFILIVIQEIPLPAIPIQIQFKFKFTLNWACNWNVVCLNSTRVYNLSSLCLWSKHLTFIKDVAEGSV